MRLVGEPAVGTAIELLTDSDKRLRYEVREMLGQGEAPPPEFSRPEVAQILMDYYQSLYK